MELREFYNLPLKPDCSGCKAITSRTGPFSTIGFLDTTALNYPTPRHEGRYVLLLDGEIPLPIHHCPVCGRSVNVFGNNIIDEA